MDLITIGLAALAVIIFLVLLTHKPKTFGTTPVVDTKTAEVNAVPTVTEIAAKAEVVSKPATQKPAVKAKAAVQAKKTAAKKPAAAKAPAKKAPAKKPATKTKKA